jgi:DNA recombination protein RmuC
LRGFQETTLKGFRELGERIGAQVKEFGGRLDTGVKAIDDRAASIATSLDRDIKQMGYEATRNRDALRQTIETKLDDAAAKQARAAKEMREEMIGELP